MTNNNLYALPEAATALGGISTWTLRRHVAQGTVQAVRLGRRVFLRAEEIERIRQEGLPSLRDTTPVPTRMSSRGAQEISGPTLGETNGGRK